MLPVAVPGLGRKLNVKEQLALAVVELLTNASVLSTTAGALEQQGISFNVAQGGAAVLFIEPLGAE